MLNMNNLNMYFDGTSSNGESQIAHFTASFSGTNNINFSFNSNDVELLRKEIDICMADFQTFVTDVLEATNSDIVVNPVEMVM